MRKKGEKLTINIANIKSRILLLFHGTSSVKKVRCIIVKKKKTDFNEIQWDGYESEGMWDSEHHNIIRNYYHSILKIFSEVEEKCQCLIKDFFFDLEGNTNFS